MIYHGGPVITDVNLWSRVEEAGVEACLMVELVVEGVGWLVELVAVIIPVVVVLNHPEL